MFGPQMVLPPGKRGEERSWGSKLLEVTVLGEQQAQVMPWPNTRLPYP